MGEEVATGSFIPAPPFHPKAYAVDNIAKGDKSFFGRLFGSGNLTGSGLLTGSECGVLSYWSEPTSAQRKAMFSAYDGMSWFEKVWENADPVSEIITKYSNLWTKSKPPIVEEDEGIVDLYVGGPDHVIGGDFAVALASAKAFWIEVTKLYKNLGPHKAGNQVDTPKGTRVFFGFPPTTVPENTVLGPVVLQNDGFGPVECSVRFADNQMDKVNLPIPGADGPDSYDNSILLFQRSGSTAGGTPKFRILTGDKADLKKWKGDSYPKRNARCRAGGDTACCSSDEISRGG